jgi:hypothetical protein
VVSNPLDVGRRGGEGWPARAAADEGDTMRFLSCIESGPAQGPPPQALIDAIVRQVLGPDDVQG